MYWGVLLSKTICTICVMQRILRKQRIWICWRWLKNAPFWKSGCMPCLTGSLPVIGNFCRIIWIPGTIWSKLPSAPRCAGACSIQNNTPPLHFFVFIPKSGKQADSEHQRSR